MKTKAEIKLEWQKHNRDNGLSWNEVSELVNQVADAIMEQQTQVSDYLINKAIKWFTIGADKTARLNTAKLAHDRANLSFYLKSSAEFLEKHKSNPQPPGFLRNLLDKQQSGVASDDPDNASEESIINICVAEIASNGKYSLAEQLQHVYDNLIIELAKSYYHLQPISNERIEWAFKDNAKFELADRTKLMNFTEFKAAIKELTTNK